MQSLGHELLLCPNAYISMLGDFVKGHCANQHCQIRSHHRFLLRNETSLNLAHNPED